MKTNPVSFKSLLIFTINDGKPKAPIPDLIRTAFKNNDLLKKYNVEKDIYVHDEEIDGTLYNANQDFCHLLDNKHKNKLPKGSRGIKISQAEFYVDAHNKENRYFITAATNEDEERILRTLGKSNLFYTARFKPKPF